MEYMFHSASAFNQGLLSWNGENLRQRIDMSGNATDVHQDVSSLGWNVTIFEMHEYMDSDSS
jgi:hypothetical protein